MLRNRSRLVVEIDLDPVPGWGNSAEDHRVHVERLLADTVGHYNPTVRICDAAMPNRPRPESHGPDVADRLQQRREELWKSYLESPNGAIEALRQGKYEGFVEGLRMVSELQVGDDA